MNRAYLTRIEDQAMAIDSFRECYKGCILWGSNPDGDVKYDVLIAWICENRGVVEIALGIGKMEATP